MLSHDAFRRQDAARETEMDGRIGSISLVVSNKARSLEFFTEKVGLEKKTDVTAPGGYRYVTVGPKGQDLELALFEIGSRPAPEQEELSKRWAPGTAPPIVVIVADCRETHAELAARGVTFLQPPVDHPWGTAATFSDPDGNLFTLSQLRVGNWSKS